MNENCYSKRVRVFMDMNKKKQRLCLTPIKSMYLFISAITSNTKTTRSIFSILNETFQLHVLERTSKEENLEEKFHK